MERGSRWERGREGERERERGREREGERERGERERGGDLGGHKLTNRHLAQRNRPRTSELSSAHF